MRRADFEVYPVISMSNIPRYFFLQEHFFNNFVALDG